MPIYEYKCDKCGKVFEEHQSIHDKAVTECVHCKGPVKRVFSPIGISFKGSGFHVTDYGKKSADAAPACPDAGSSSSCKTCADASPKSS